jgi:hypothetical protein
VNFREFGFLCSDFTPNGANSGFLNLFSYHTDSRKSPPDSVGFQPIFWKFFRISIPHVPALEYIFIDIIVLSPKNNECFQLFEIINGEFYKNTINISNSFNAEIYSKSKYWVLEIIQPHAMQ